MPEIKVLDDAHQLGVESTTEVKDVRAMQTTSASPTITTAATTTNAAAAAAVAATAMFTAAIPSTATAGSVHLTSRVREEPRDTLTATHR